MAEGAGRVGDSVSTIKREERGCSSSSNKGACFLGSGRSAVQHFPIRGHSFGVKVELRAMAAYSGH